MKLYGLNIALGIGSCLLLAACAQRVTDPSIPGSGQAVNEVIVQGQNTPLHGAYTRVNGACRYAVSQPVTFHNSGRRAVTLDQLAPVFGVKPLIIFGENARDMSHSIDSQMFFTSEFNRSQLGLTAKQLMQQRTFVPSYERVGDQIESGEIYTFYINILVDVMPGPDRARALAASVNIGAIFNNRQILTVEPTVRLIKDVLENCG